MGIRELAAEAKVAEDAHKKAEKKRIWAVNARRGEQTVKNLLGIEGKAHRANNDEEKDHGDGTTVLLEDDLHVKVTVRPIYAKSTVYSRWDGTNGIDAYEVYLMLADEMGSTFIGTLDNKITSLASLHDALNKQDKYLAEKAAYEARRAEKAAAAKV